MMQKPRAMPMSGEVNSGMTTLRRTPSHMTCSVPPVNTMVAPMSEPMSACDDELGIERHQVKRSQTTAPTSAARMT